MGPQLAGVDGIGQIGSVVNPILSSGGFECALVASALTCPSVVRQSQHSKTFFMSQNFQRFGAKPIHEYSLSDNFVERVSHSEPGL